ncbi:biosynthetic peptidoglycan transglycosylase, partial [Acidisoma sp. C75]
MSARRQAETAAYRPRRAAPYLAILGAILLAGAAFGAAALLLAAPSVAQAPAIVRQFAARHHERPVRAPGQRFEAALIATEDHRFRAPYDFGVDPIALIRVLLSAIEPGGQDSGGSSIDQQLAKMLFTPGQSGRLMADLKQIAFAVDLHIAYRPATILRMYATMAYFGSGYYGVESASVGYFGRPSADLSWAEAAMLAGLVNAPTADDPRNHPA